MIGPLWEEIVARMAAKGYSLDSSEADSLVDRHYSIMLPAGDRDDGASTFNAARIIREIKIRIQFRERRDHAFSRIRSEAVEEILVAMRGIELLFENFRDDTAKGGYIVEISFSYRDRLMATDRIPETIRQMTEAEMVAALEELGYTVS